METVEGIESKSLPIALQSQPNLKRLYSLSLSSLFTREKRRLTSKQDVIELYVCRRWENIFFFEFLSRSLFFEDIMKNASPALSLWSLYSRKFIFGSNAQTFQKRMTLHSIQEEQYTVENEWKWVHDEIEGLSKRHPWKSDTARSLNWERLWCK